MGEYPKLPRKPLGYDPAAVDRLISERDSMLGLAEHRIRQAEARLAEMEEQLKTRDQLLIDVQAELDARDLAASEALTEEPLSEAVEPPPLTPKFMTDELSKIVVAAEGATNQIIQRAWAATRDQVVEADRLWKEVQDEAVRFATWREDAAAIVLSVKRSIEAAREKIERVPQRVQEALAPAVEAMVDVDAGMAKFADASTMPLLVAPAGLDTIRQLENAAVASAEGESFPESEDELEAMRSRPYPDSGDAEGEDTPIDEIADGFDDVIDPSAVDIWRGSA
jgi:hypothetical protein